MSCYSQYLAFRKRVRAYHRYYKSVEKAQFVLLPRNYGSNNKTAGHHVAVSRGIAEGPLIVGQERCNSLMVF